MAGILLIAGTDKLQLVTSAAVAVDVHASFVDRTSGGVNNADKQNTAIATATTTDVVAAPTGGDVRNVKTIMIRNKGASPNTVTVVYDQNGTDFELYKAELSAGEQLTFSEVGGWVTSNADSLLYESPSVTLSPIFTTAALTGTRSITSTNTMALYMGRAPKALTSVKLRCRVTTAAATITWAEVGLARGTPVMGGNPTLTAVGFADVSASYNSTGQKTTTINVSSGQVVQRGDDIWLLVGNQATTALVVRAQTMADDLQAGLSAAAVTRPSSNIGTGVAYTIDGAAILPMWLAIDFT